MTVTSHPIPPLRKLRWLRLLAYGFLTCLVLISGQHWLASPNLSNFDPVRMGQSEAAMWRSYYEGRWFDLLAQTLRVSCGEYGFSWWDGSRLAFAAARSAKRFRVNSTDPRCLPDLENYYSIIATASPGKFNLREAAELELAWWQARRKKVPTSEYAHTIAQIGALVYGLKEAETYPSALARAEAMAYRDARRDGKMDEAAWSEVSRQLVSAYSSLHKVLHHAN